MSSDANPRSQQVTPRSSEPVSQPAEPFARRRSRLLRWTGLALVIADVALVVGLAGQESLLTQPGGPRYVVAVLLVLAAYVVAVMAVTAARRPSVAAARRTGVTIGVTTGAMWMLSLAIETFAGLNGWPNLAATGPLLLGGFALWGVAGGLTARRTGSIAAGALGAVCAATTCVAITIAFGFTLAYVALPRLERTIDGSPEYLDSGWHNLPAFAIANTLDAALTHLLITPIIAVILGTLAALVARKRQADPQPI